MQNNPHPCHLLFVDHASCPALSRPVHRRFDDAISLLTLVSVSSSGMNQCVAALPNDHCHASKFIFFEHVEHLLTILTPTRLEIIRLLCDKGPLPAEAIAARLDHDRLSISQDLGALLDAQVVDLERDASYLFGFDGIRIVLQYTRPALKGEPS